MFKLFPLSAIMDFCHQSSAMCHQVGGRRHTRGLQRKEETAYQSQSQFRTFRHKTFRQQDGGRRFGNFLLPKRLWCRNVFTAGERRFGNIL